MRTTTLTLAALLLVACGDDSTGGDADAGSSDSGTPGTDAGPDTDVDAGPRPDAGTPPVTGHEGFGATTQGAESSPDGFTDCVVTTLADDGPGSLRDCVSAEKRMVTFEVGGTIVLESDLNVPYSYITIDGSTAPDPGITIEQPGNIGTTIEARGSVGPAHDIVIQHLRMDGQATSHLNEGDIWGLDGQSNPVHDIVIDHVTGIASTDGVFDVWAEVRDVTISWCLILDTETALHFSGPGAEVRENFSFHHNVFARNNERQVRLRHDNRTIDFVNNVIYGWGWFEAGAAGLHIAYDGGENNPSLNVVNNVYHHVGSTRGGPDDAIRFEMGPDVGQVYFDGNVVPSGESDDVSTGAALPIPAAAAVTTFPASELGAMVVPFAGTHFPTPAETALLTEIAAAL